MALYHAYIRLATICAAISYISYLLCSLIYGHAWIFYLYKILFLAIL